MRHPYKPDRAYKAIGLKIRALREERGWTLEDLEERSDISWQQLQKIESGRNITVRTIVRISNALGVHPKVLFEDL